MARGGISALKLTWGPGGPKKRPSISRVSATGYLEWQRRELRGMEPGTLRVPRGASAGTLRYQFTQEPGDAAPRGTGFYFLGVFWALLSQMTNTHFYPKYVILSDRK